VGVWTLDFRALAISDARSTQKALPSYSCQFQTRSSPVLRRDSFFVRDGTVSVGEVFDHAGFDVEVNPGETWCARGNGYSVAPYRGTSFIRNSPPP